MNQENPENRLAVGGTVAVLAFAGFLLMMWFMGPAAGTNAQRQNRPQSEFPQMSLSAAADVTTFEQATAALNDRVRAKPSVVENLNSTVLNLTGRSPSADVVARGDELYFAGEFTEPCLDPQYATWARDSARSLAAAAKRGGKQVLFVVVPSKSVAVPPGGVGAAALMSCQRWSQQVLRDIASERGSPVRIVEPDEVAAMAGGTGYWKGDTHWTPRGGQALSSLLAQEVGGSTTARFVSGPTFEHQGDLYRLLGIPRTEPTDVMGPRAAAMPTFESVPNGTAWPMTAFTSPDPLPGAPNLLLVYDSFVYATGLEAQIASLFPAGWLVQWDAMPDVTQAGDAGLVVMESTDRLAVARLASLNPGGPNQAFLDYLSGDEG